MTRKKLLGKILFFAVLLSMALSLAAVAHADGNPCEGGQHKGPFTYTLIQSATCTANGSQEKFCSACGQKIGTEPILAIGHIYETVYSVVTPATCTTNGLRQNKSICRVCGYQQSVTDETINALGHDYGAWAVTKAATCTAAGEETRICAYDASHKETRPVAATGHKWDAGKVTQAATCKAAGVRTFTCQNDSSHTRTESIPLDPNGHKWDAGKVTKAPTCAEPGVRVYTCQLDASHTKTETIPIDPNAHNWDEGKVTTPPDCETPGVRTYTCRLDASHKKTESIPAIGHKWDKGTVTKEPTLTESGIRHFVCQNNSAHTKDETISRITFNNNTVCAFGPRLRDVNLYPYDTDVWYMFTPFDASQDGRQTYELVASNTYIVGTLTLEIKDGNLTVDYTLNSSTIDITLEFFTVLNQIDEITQYEPEQLLDRRMTVKRPINLEETFGEDRNLVLYFCSRCNYTYSNRFTGLDYHSALHQRLLTDMLDMMDR